MEKLIVEALSHKAVHHPYLLALKEGQFANMKEVLKDFALQYGSYSAWFPRYLDATISQLLHSKHREPLMQNLAEEKGQLEEIELIELRKLGINDEWVKNIPHPELFNRFKKAIGVPIEDEASSEVMEWRKSLLDLLMRGNEAECIGAIGLGTEIVVKHIYKYIIDAISAHTNLSLEEYVFFPLHTEVDDEHGKILLSIADDLIIEIPNAEEDLRKGMISALNLRAKFWDDMYQRAIKIDMHASLTSTSN
jgi:pyrroloquinoline quinone (PQQ) biosynthesis protein C